jgi:uncharacterized protein
LFGLSGRWSRSPWLEVAQAALSAFLISGFAVANLRMLKPLLRLRQFGRPLLRMIATLAVLFVLVMTVYFALIRNLGVPMLRIIDIYQRTHWPVWSMFVMVSLMPALFEELAFRGVIQSGLTGVVRAREAWLIQAALFSVMHLSPVMFPSHFAMGLTFGYLRLRSRSLYPGMLLHAFWNALVLCSELFGSALIAVK